MATPKKIHFMGIGGSGTSACAQIAKLSGFEVTGCNMDDHGEYLITARSAGIPITIGHSASHLQDTDLLIVTPAVFFQNSTHPEYLQAKAANKVLTWQQFAGKYLTPDKDVIAIAGTHGKSTTTALAGLLLELAGLDPTVNLGATVPAWHTNMRFGHSNYFVIEADEYYHNFLSYTPQVIILNNIELDHPEYFGTLDKFVAAFQQFVGQLKSGGLLIFNADSPAVATLVAKEGSPLNSRNISVQPYSLSKVNITSQTPTGTDFRYNGLNYHLQIPGLHNVANSLGIIELAAYLHVPHHVVNQVLISFQGISRRLELIGESHGITVLDDYANHPSAFKATLQAASQKYPNSHIWAVIEPHTFSRLRAVLADLPASLSRANHVIISQIFPSRETDPGDFSGADIAAVIPKSRYIPDFPDIVKHIKTHAQPSDVILVMGSGNSSLLAKAIYNSL